MMAVLPTPDSPVINPMPGLSSNHLKRSWRCCWLLLSLSKSVACPNGFRISAIVCYKNTHFYQSYKDEILLSSRQSKLVPKSSEFELSAIDGKKVAEILEDLHLKTSNMNEEFFDNVASVCKGKINLYA
jgi:hypothetical protein